MVWHLATALKLNGDVRNDSEGVLIQLWGSASRIDQFIRQLPEAAPPLAHIESIECSHLTGRSPTDFQILQSQPGEVHTAISPDAASCPACIAEIFDPQDRRYRYPFTNCTHCGPRLSIVQGIPYDRKRTSMAVFELCPTCQAEYDDPNDRRFHAQPNACPLCGPQLWLESSCGQRIDSDDPVIEAARRIRCGDIVAIKGIGGFHLAVDATNHTAVERLRQRKQREQKPFALMARSVALIRCYCSVNAIEQRALLSSAAPIVVLDRISDTAPLAAAVAPGQNTLGFILPYSPLHHLLMETLEQPIVLTSGNHTDQPQLIDNDLARNHLSTIADWLLLHDRTIINRVDDSVVRIIANRPRLLRRARGYAPAPIRLPQGFQHIADQLAMGSELKNSFCLTHRGEAILSQQIGDLEDYATFDDYQKILALYRRLFQHQPEAIAVDAHPGYHSTQLGHQLATQSTLPIRTIQHHHAHIAACLVDNGYPLSGPAVLGIALDGNGLGDDGTLWGGEFLLADYRHCQRLAHFKPVALPGGIQAIRQPWRSCYAQLAAIWQQVIEQYPTLELVDFLQQKPLKALDTMMMRGINSPSSSSCGRLFDAVAAALGICRDAIHYEGEAAMRLEALVETEHLRQLAPYPFAVQSENDRLILDPTPMWQALLADLATPQPAAHCAARFHRGLVAGLIETVYRLAEQHPVSTIALSGGVFQNHIILKLLIDQLSEDFTVFSHHQVPANDGGLALGQAVIAASAKQ